ncbi:MAG TPA: hypothetical protein VGM65_06540 [Candidatus Udaeobacter sp.]
MANTQSGRSIPYSPTPFSTWLGIVCLFAVFGLIVLAVIGPSPRGSDYERTRAQKRMERLKALREDNQKELTSYAWVDKSKGIARIPIDRAMEVTTAELAKKKPAPAGPIATPPPAQVSPAAAVNPSPAPAGSPSSGTAQASPRVTGAVSPSPAARQPSPSPASPAPASTP